MKEIRLKYNQQIANIISISVGSYWPFKNTSLTPVKEASEENRIIDLSLLTSGIYYVKTKNKVKKIYKR